MKSAKFFPWVVLLFFAAVCSALATNDLVLQNETISGGQNLVLKARNTITAGPNYVVAPEAAVTLQAGTSVILRPGFHARSGSSVHVRVWSDAQKPAVISSYPEDDSYVTTVNGSLSLLVTFGDTDSGIFSVRLLDAGGNDITSSAILGGNTVELILTDLADGTYRYTLILEDWAGNTTSYDMNFTVDRTPPATVASVPGGNYDGAVSVDLTCSEDATIYYSTDGYPPFVGAANTTAAAAPVNDILIDNSRILQFFAVDRAGNIETTKSETYFLDKVPDAVNGLTAVFDAGANRITLQWQPHPDAVGGYNVYRCISPFECDILLASRDGGFAPTDRLKQSQAPVADNQYLDPAIVPDAIYRYGVAVVDAAGVVGIISDLAQVEIPATGSAAGKEEAVARALVWLEMNQNEKGYWENDEHLRILATSQILNAIKLSGRDGIGVRQALFYLRGHHPDNNDYLARKILTLHRFGQNADAITNRLVAQGLISGTKIKGWGLQKHFYYDAVDTALGTLAADSAQRTLEDQNDISHNNRGWYYLRYDNSLQSSTAERFGWVSGSEPSVYVSALVYHVLDAHYDQDPPVFDSQWIADSQNADDGSFGSGPVDTAAVLLWHDLTDSARDAAIGYLVSQQSINGSWQEDPYLTGLCLEALLTD